MLNNIEGIYKIGVIILHLLNVKTLKAPNIFSLDQNIILMRIKLGEFVDTPTKDIHGFNESIINLFPGLIEHKCTKGYRGGFLERLKEGTYLAHVTEHLCLELLRMIGNDVKFGKARNETEDIYKVIFACNKIPIGKACAFFIYEVVSKLIRNENVAFDKDFRRINTLNSTYELGVSTRAIYNEAKKRGIPINEVSDSGLFRLGYGKYQRFISATLFENTSSIAVDIACDKALTKTLLDEVSIPVPKGQVCFTVQEAFFTAEEIGYPVVVKPNFGNQGKHVSVNITNPAELETAFVNASNLGQEVLIEKYITGKDYRVLLVNGKVAAVAERTPASVKGDGIHTVKELIDLENADELRGDDHDKPLTKIIIDDYVTRLIQKQGFSLDSILFPEKILYLRANSNLSTGGTAIDRTNNIHPDNIKIAELAVKTIGLDIAGIDIVMPDISKPIKNGYGAIVEVNAAPGIRMHLKPSKGMKRDVVSPILDMIYPPGKKFSVPIISITGTNGKTTTTRMISHILKDSGFVVGMTTTHGIYINGQCVEAGDTTGYQSAKRVLNDRQVDVCVLETARGGIIKNGLGYKKADIAVFTNLSNDHLGIDNINNMDDLFHVKSLVTEAVKPDGFCLINADDPWTLRAKEKAGGKIILYSLNKKNPFLTNHIKDGGSAIFLDNNSIFISESGNIKYLIDVKTIPATLDGILKHNVYNSITAAGACYALGIPLINIKKALMTFSCEPSVNPGRFNIFKFNGITVILDYGHNYQGYKVTLESVKKLTSTKLTGIIGVPGDRRNEDIFNVGKLAGNFFDRLIIKEDKDLRNRQPMEVADILKFGALQSGMNKENIEIIQNEEEALDYAIITAQKEEIIVVFFEEMKPLIRVIEKFKSRSTDLPYACIK